MTSGKAPGNGPLIAFSVFVCLLIVGLIGWYHGFNSGIESHQGISAQAFRLSTERYVQDNCLELSGEPLYQCVASAVGLEREQQRSEQDLDAQQQMAEWAKWMLIITLIMCAVTTFGVVFVWQTLAATQQMVKDTSRIGEAQTRAYLQVHKVRLVRVNDGPGFLFSLVVENTGQTPARDVLAEVGLGWTKGRLSRVDKSRRLNQRATLGTGQTLLFNGPIREPSEGEVFVVYAFVSYRTIWGKRCKTIYTGELTQSRISEGETIVQLGRKNNNST